MRVSLRAHITKAKPTKNGGNKKESEAANKRALEQFGDAHQPLSASQREPSSPSITK